MKAVPSLGAVSVSISFLAPFTRADPIIEAAPGTALFHQFRPTYHFLGEKWMNDPCAPYYDESTGLYHMFYQLNPTSTIWGNMTWGHAVSKDQVTWQDYPNALRPFESKWDELGVFSGFAMPHAIDGKHTVFYTGVTKLPISWKLPYLFGEHVLAATTSDDGKTWQRRAEPLIEGPPPGLDVTGWRDPMPFHSTSLDAYFGYVASNESGSNYLIVAGGVRDVGPRIFLYHAHDYEHWKYHGYLLAAEKNTSFSAYSANWGFNFEMTIYRELVDDEGHVHNVMFFAAEGETSRYAMWAAGSFAAGGCGIEVDLNAGLFTPLMVGISDRSDWYANNIYTDKDGKNILIGWITESNNFTTGQPQGWDGILSLPREVSISTVHNIHDGDERLVGHGDWIVSDVKDLTCADGTTKQSKTIKTLGIKPLSNLELLRNANAVEKVDKIALTNASHVLNSTGVSFELLADITEFERGSQVGFQVRRSSADDEVTTIVYDDAEKKVRIDRSQSSTAECAVFVDHAIKPKADPVWGYFTLYDQFIEVAQGDACATSRETLQFHVFVDVSSVEVFVNGRFALSARIYPCASQTKSDGIALLASGSATFGNVQVWTDLKPAWPETRTVPTF